jgi:hypothetical protein
MSLLTKTPASAGLMSTLLGGRGLAPPPARDIFLLDCHIAGSGYYGAHDHPKRLALGMPLRLQRQPQNPHDALAIEVHAAGAEPFKLGYVPRKHNPVLARLMDAGKELTARLSQVEGGLWGDPRMEIHLRDW